jgi:nicotinamide mononucleotide transporter
MRGSSREESVVSFIHWLFNAQVHFGSKSIYWKEIIGNVFGLASALLGMRRKMWTWPVGIIGNVLLFTLFIGGLTDHNQQTKVMLGQAGRQVLFILVSVYGWQKWIRNREADGSQKPVKIRWTTTKEKMQIVPVVLVFFTVSYYIIKALGSWAPFPDTWIFTGSALATYGLARGYVEFWLVWIAVDAVGTPLLIKGGYYPSAALYLIYGAFVIWGFVNWLLIAKREKDLEPAV